MSTREYQRKRNFARTPEPGGAEEPNDSSAHGGTFVVQKHDARRLHYDLRLELGGVLKSWAVPKGPTLDPDAKRLAVHVEDHPLEYQNFEGVIPRGEYGAGPVVIWDRGRWLPEGTRDPAEAYRRGRLRFRLEGRKLHGAWALVRMGGADPERENWLLKKVRDRYARKGDAAFDEHSVVSGRTIEALRAEVVQPARRSGRGARRTHAAAVRAQPVAVPGPRRPLPDQLAPQLATLTTAVPAGDGWLHEIKYDGYRLLARIEDGAVRLLTRSALDWTDRFPAIAQALAGLAVGSAWLDGEVVAFEPDGTTSFQRLQEALSRGEDTDLVYLVFDLLYRDGADLRDRPLLDRKRHLASVFAGVPDGACRLAEHVRGHGADFYRAACRHGLEGVVSKRIDGRYLEGRTRQWMKVKCLRRQELVIGGFTDPGGARQGLGALLLGVYGSDGRLHYAGRVGTGFNDEVLRDLRRRLEALARADSPYAEGRPADVSRGVHWVHPELVAEISFSDWTRDGRLRRPVFEGLREDKAARAVRREAPARPPPSVRAPLRGRGAPAVKLTNPDKVLYPDIGVTKRELLAYYGEVAGRVLADIAGRPLALLRCPEGYQAHCFFQKHANPSTPAEIGRVTLPEKDGTATFLAVGSEAGLYQLVQMGVLEIHVRGARADRVDRPDRVVFDLDPHAAALWEVVLLGALQLHETLAGLGLSAFVRTTGGKGLHVVVPLVRRSGWDEVKAFSKAVAQSIVRTVGARYFTLRVGLQHRDAKVYIDYLRNTPQATAIANYSTRARPGAPVAVPLRWEELDPALRPDQYNVRNLRQRLQSLESDPWEGFDATRQSITRDMLDVLEVPAGSQGGRARRSERS